MALLEEAGRAFDVAAHVTGAAWTRDRAAFALGDGTVRYAGLTGDPVSVAAHRGACLALAPDTGGLLTGGDDGRLVRSLADGTAETLAETKGRWIEHVVTGPSGAIAWASGRRVTVRVSGRDRGFEAPSGVGGLAFMPKGLRLAAAHYGGVTIWWAAADSPPTRLEWKGSHTGLAVSPDGRFLITTMQENALHGWRLADGKDLRMTGYPGKIRSLSWSAKGRYLATSGAEAVVLWPFQGKDGPMGKSGQQIGARPQLVTAVACHPGMDVVAAGYADGTVLLLRIEDGAEIPVAGTGGGPVTALAWEPQGLGLAFGTDQGRAGVIGFAR